MNFGSCENKKAAWMARKAWTQSNKGKWSGMKTCHKTSIISEVPENERQVDQWYKTEIPETDSNAYGNLTYFHDDTSNLWSKHRDFNKWH